MSHQTALRKWYVCCQGYPSLGCLVAWQTNPHGVARCSLIWSGLIRPGLALQLRDESGRIIGQGVAWYQQWQGLAPGSNAGLVSAAELQEKTDVGAHLHVAEEHARGGQLGQGHGLDLERAVQGMQPGSAHIVVTTAGLAVCVMVAAEGDEVLVFDSHARGKDGLPAPGGSGILVTCHGKPALVTYLRRFYAESEGTAFESLPVYLKVEG
jgi:hypothetical protein